MLLLFLLSKKSFLKALECLVSIILWRDEKKNQVDDFLKG